MDYKASIIICSYKRPQELKRCLKSVYEQTYKNFEVILCEDEGNLVELKEKGWRKSDGDILVWLDDDIELCASWLGIVMRSFRDDEEIVGVSGPTIVPEEYRKNRDIFKGGLLKVMYNWFFLEGKAYLPGRITSCGANTIGANYPTYHTRHAQYVDFLEPSAFAMRRWVVEEENGYDLSYTGVAEWCDVDLCYRIKKHGTLLFNPLVVSGHYPIRDATTNKRLDTRSRYINYCMFADRYIKKSFKNMLYRLFLKTYFYLKGKRLI